MNLNVAEKWVSRSERFWDGQLRAGEASEISIVIVQFLDIAIGGLLTGGIYALIAVGFGLQYGVARVLNIAHGEFIMLGAFCAWTLFTSAGITPLVSMLFCAPFFFAIGYVIYRILYTPLRTSSESPAVFEGNSMLASFGLLFVVQNLALIIWGSPGQGLFVPRISDQVAQGRSSRQTALLP